MFSQHELWMFIEKTHTHTHVCELRDTRWHCFTQRGCTPYAHPKEYRHSSDKLISRSNKTFTLQNKVHLGCRYQIQFIRFLFKECLECGTQVEPYLGTAECKERRELSPFKFFVCLFFFYINPKTSAAIKSAIMYVNCVQIYRVERGITLSSNSKIGYPREIQQIGDTT